MNPTVLKVIISYVLVLSIGISSILGLKIVASSVHDEYEGLKKQATKLNTEIDSISSQSTKDLNSKLKFYETYFEKKRQLYILDIWGLIEFILPANNFVNNVSMSTDASMISLEFKQSEIESLLKVHTNLTNLQNRGLITGFTFTDLNLEGGETLLDSKYKLYKINITFEPSILEDNRKIINFLALNDKYYNSIYTGPLKEVKCEEYVNESDGETYCKEINESTQDDIQNTLEEINEENQEADKKNKKKEEILKEKEKANKIAENLIKEDEKAQKKAAEKIKDKRTTKKNKKK